MKILRSVRSSDGFTLAEVGVAIGIVTLFGLAAFATNQRLLFALKSQKETTAASMAMQWRMEKFRSTAFSDIADRDYVKNNILKIRTATDANGNTINPFAALGNITEQFTINQYPAPAPSPTPTVISWDAQHAGGQDISQNSNLKNQAAAWTPGVTFRGAWSASTAYSPPDGVSYSNKLWINQQANTGTAPGTNGVWLQTVTTIKVDVLETWTGANGRQRRRQLSSIFTLGNIGQ